MIGALIGIVVSAVTGATVVFIIVGGVLCFIVIYAVQEAFRRVLAARGARLDVKHDQDRGRPAAEPSSRKRPTAPPERH
jgi:uncharacterized membrane protein YfcA